MSDRNSSRRRARAALFTCGLCLAAAPGGAGAAEARDDTLARAVAHLVSVQLPDGLFRYDFDFLDGEPSGRDNIVRQAGTLYALAEYLALRRDPAALRAVRRGLEALRESSLPIGRGTGQSVLEAVGGFAWPSWRLGIWLDERGLLYRPEGDGLVVTGNGRYAGAFSGATSLALLSELEYHRATGSADFAEAREGWLRGLYTLHVPGRGVRDHPETLTEGPYVNGEAWLAYAVYHELFPEDAEAAEALGELEEYVLELYSEAPDSNFYHWGAMASAVRAEPGDTARIVAFAAQQAEFILEARPPQDSAKRTTCSLIEGLTSSIAAVSAQPAGREALLERMRARVADELAHNRGLQIAPGQQEMALGGGGRLFAPSLAASHGAILAGPTSAYTRTDLTQHCISAFTKARRYGLDGPGPPNEGADPQGETE